MPETTYENISVTGGEIAHKYGRNVHLLADPLALSWLARVCSPKCVQPGVNQAVALLYRGLVHEVMNREFPRTVIREPTRMSVWTERGYYKGQVIDPNVEVTTVDIARAGILPSMVCFEALCEVLNPASVRQDHILMNRATDAQHRVTGADMFGKKIAGPVDGRILLFPDPMGATGSSLSEAIRYYETAFKGRARRIYTLNLIVTPEFIRRITEEWPEVSIYAYRLDRGLSPPDVLATMPGERWAEERGLTESQYIVPGAGGMGEIMNNALT